ncbi:condensation domain-containing protein [Streptosporangium fragile]|uniref:Condensation domain-containing protein n=1 Tax=Streptosporangium fragile TaxID=46186 RepID=A0ABN3VRC4_9ACTN
MPNPLARSGPLTWGQRWHWLEHQLPYEKRQPHQPAAYCPIPAGLTVQDAREAVEVVVARHEALRSTFSMSRPVQFVGDPGPVRVEVLELEDAVSESSVHQVSARLAPRGFDIEEAPPWRAAVLTRDGVPQELVMILHHLLVDGWSCRLLAEELATLLEQRAGGQAFALPPVRWQPLDQARSERSPRVLEDSRRAVDHWRECIAESPVNLLGPFRGEGGDPSVCHRVTAFFTQAAADCARVAEKHGVSAANVIMTAFSCAVLERAGAEQLFVDLVVSNRFSADARSSIGSLALPGIVRVGAPRGASFGAVLEQTARNTLRAYRFSHCNPCDFKAVEIEQTTLRGMHLQSTLLVNYHSYGNELPQLLTSELLEPDRITVASIPAGFAFETLYVDVVPRAEGILIDLYTGDRALGPAQAEELLDRVRGLLHEAALDGDAPAVRPDAAPAPGPGWVAVDNGWVSLPATEALLARNPAVTHVTVLREERGLVAYVVPGPSGTTPQEIHRHLGDRLADDAQAMTPHWYVLCADRPDDPADGRAWRDRPVVAEGDGRDAPPRGPATGAEEALGRAFLTLHPGARFDPNLSFSALGGEFMKLPVMLEELRRLGYQGVSFHAFTSSCSLAHVASQLEGVR